MAAKPIAKSDEESEANHFEEQLFEAEVKFLREREAKERAEAAVRSLQTENIAQALQLADAVTAAAAAELTDATTQTAAAVAPVLAMRAPAPPPPPPQICDAGMQTQQHDEQAEEAANGAAAEAAASTPLSKSAMPMSAERHSRQSRIPVRSRPSTPRRSSDGAISASTSTASAFASTMPPPSFSYASSASTVGALALTRALATRAAATSAATRAAAPSTPMGGGRAPTFDEWMKAKVGDGSPQSSFLPTPSSRASSRGSVPNSARSARSAKSAASPATSSASAARMVRVRDEATNELISVSPGRLFTALIAMHREKEEAMMARVTELERMLATIFPELRKQAAAGSEEADPVFLA